MDKGPMGEEWVWKNPMDFENRNIISDLVFPNQRDILSPLFLYHSLLDSLSGLVYFLYCKWAEATFVLRLPWVCLISQKCSVPLS